MAKKDRNDERVMQEVLFKWQPSGGGGGGEVEDGYYEGGVRLEGEPDGYWVNGTKIASDLLDGFYFLKEGNINLITYLFTSTDENYPFIDQLNEVSYTAGTSAGFYDIGELE
jgi:hypothetical protein